MITPYGFIYITHNKINDKKYLGMCRYDQKKNTDTYLGSGKQLKESIKKYGKDNFYKEIVCECYSPEELSSKEIEYIQKYDCVNSRDWYNIASGGYTTRGFLGKKHSNHTKQKMSQSYKRELTEDGKKKIGQSAIKSKSYLKAAEARKSITGSKHHRSIPVIVNGIKYPSMNIAVRKTGINYYQIRKMCLNQQDRL
jgi:hypothetical protein